MEASSSRRRRHTTPRTIVIVGDSLVANLKPLLHLDPFKFSIEINSFPNVTSEKMVCDSKYMAAVFRNRTRRCDVCIIVAGSNDIGQFSPVETAQAFDQMHNYCISKRVSNVFVCEIPGQTKFNQTLNDLLLDFNLLALNLRESDVEKWQRQDAITNVKTLNIVGLKLVAANISRAINSCTF